MNQAIDNTIQNIERLYHSVTGATPTSGEQPYAAIPPEIDAQKHVEQQLERLLAIVGETPAQLSAQPEWMPPVTIWETERDIVASIELAGVAREDVRVTARGPIIEVSGYRRPPWVNGNDGSRIRMTERPFGSFRRALALPPKATTETINAQWRDGVLEIRVPRERGTTAAGERNIEVR